MIQSRSAIIGITAGVAVYLGLLGFDRLMKPDHDDPVAGVTTVSPNMTPGDTVTRGAKIGANLGVTTVSPNMTPGDTVTKKVTPTVTPSNSPAFTPVPYTTLTPSPSKTLSPTITVTPVPFTTFTPSPTPTPSLAPSPSATQTPETEPTPTPMVNTNLVINEIAWMGTSADANDEWIELYNYGDSVIDLTGWSLIAQDGSPKINLLGSIVAGGYYLLERTASSSTSIAEDMLFTGSLENGGEVLELRDPQGNVRDAVNSWYAGDNSLKATMERVSPSVAGDEPSNWVTFSSLQGVGYDAEGNPIQGTPRSPNGGSI